MSQTAYRTHHATEVTEALVGQKVTLAGWVDRRRDHGGVAFIDLRDSTGLVQVVIYDEDMARPLRSEFVIQITGEVRLRPDGNENTHLATGKIEVVAETIEILAKSDALPFQVSTALENESENKLPGEDVRLKYRYLDLRRPSMQHNLKLRSDMAKAARHALEDMDFTEVETPTFIKSTPEGARDFVVPARLVPGSWYALPQSPQLLKQLLMVSGVERYYQLARCYRDEDFRADRQPEFTQLDMEMAYVDQEDVMAMTEKVIAAIWKSAGYEVQLPLPRITWKDAMDKYGSDKPDLRFGNPLVELTEYFKNTPFYMVICMERIQPDRCFGSCQEHQQNDQQKHLGEHGGAGRSRHTKPGAPDGNGVGADGQASYRIDQEKVSDNVGCVRGQIGSQRDPRVSGNKPTHPGCRCATQTPPRFSEGPGVRVPDPPNPFPILQCGSYSGNRN